MGENEFVSEYLSVWHFTHQQLHHDSYFLALESEAFRTVWRLPDGLIESVESIWVFSANGLDSPSVEKIFAELVAGFAFWERSLLDEVVGCIDVAVAEVAPQQQIQKSGLADFVAAHTRSVIGIQ